MKLGIQPNISGNQSNKGFIKRFQNSPVFSGLLDDYTNNLVGWWGLKKRFTPYLGKCIRVRRSSDNFEENIGFDNSTGLVDTTAIADFCGASQGFITRIYDQSGNQNSVDNTVLANQIQIYNGTTLDIDSTTSLPSIQGETTRGDRTGRYSTTLGTAASIGLNTNPTLFGLTCIIVGGADNRERDGLVVLKDASGNKMRFSILPKLVWKEYHGINKTPLISADNELRAYVHTISDLTNDSYNYKLSVNNWSETGETLFLGNGRPDFTTGTIEMDLFSTYSWVTYNINFFEAGLLKTELNQLDRDELENNLATDLGL